MPVVTVAMGVIPLGRCQAIDGEFMTIGRNEFVVDGDVGRHRFESSEQKNKKESMRRLWRNTMISIFQARSMSSLVALCVTHGTWKCTRP